MAIGDLITRVYQNFRGVDFLNDASVVDIRRSPDALNVWKSYNNSLGNYIETRPGYRLVKNLGTQKINGIYVYSIDTALIHIGNELIEWVGFPSEEISKRVLFSEMNNQVSEMFRFADSIYILDGKNYLRYDGEIHKVKDEAFIPTTTISRSPSGGGEEYQDVNLLQPKRKNSFSADGTAVDYYLDATNITSVDKVWINDALVTNYTHDLSKGKVTFSTAPAKPSVIGKDNVVIEFTKQVENYTDRIQKCTIAKVFDNRIFFSGNSNFPNAVFHCSLNNPAYISDLDYYECGSKDNAIKSLVIGNNLLWVLKNSNQNRDTIFYLSPTTDANYGRIYPTKQGNVSIGCKSKAINYQDNIVFLSEAGLEGIVADIQSEQSVNHRSSLIDTRMINLSNYSFANMCEYNGYLIIGIDNKIFLADNRQIYSTPKGNEFEWYYWELANEISILKEYRNKLYFGDKDGNIYEFDGTNDNGEIIKSYWTTPRDAFGYFNHLKTMNKRGSIVKLRNTPNGRIKIAEKTNKGEWKLLKEASISGFDFEKLDFSNFSFSTGDHSYIVFRIKEKKIIDISIKIYSDELDKPFGLINETIEAYLGGYVKR